MVFASSKNVDYNYTKWLGKGYKCLPAERCGMYVANHVGYFDPHVYNMTTFASTGFAVAEWTKKLPIVGKVVSW
jgi:1-acyl-sn-glycerol-3-phosphate acyltransferase